MQAAARANARAGKCASCGKSVGVGQGFAFLDPDQGWSVSCDDAACRALCGTRDLVADTSVTDAQSVALSRKANEVFGLAHVAVMRSDASLALAVCRTLVELEPHYVLFAKGTR